MSASTWTWGPDTKTGDGRVYAHTKISNKSDSATIGYMSSGKRSDGEKSFARVSDDSFTIAGGTTGTKKYEVKACRTATFDDPCSVEYARYGY